MRLTFDDYVLDVVHRELRQGANTIAMEPQVFDLLAHLVQNPDRIISRDEFLQAVWAGRLVSDSAIANRVNGARRAIGDSGEVQRRIRTVPRKGFRFVGPVHEEPAITPRAPRAERGQHSFLKIAACVAAVVLAAGTSGVMIWPGVPASQELAPRALLEPMAIDVGSGRHPIGLPKVGLIVLPFTAVSGDGDQFKLAGGITESLTAQFTRSIYYRVTPRETAAAYAQRPVDAKQISRELGVRYMVDGSVEQSGGQIRVTVRFADAETGAYLWAQRYDRPVGDLLDIEDEIVGRTVNGIGRALVFSEADRPPPNDSDAARLVWRGTAMLVGPASRAQEAEAAAVFARALQLSPTLVPAKIRLAYLLARSGHGLFNVNDAMKVEQASRLIDDALAAWPEYSGGHFVKGMVLRIQGHCDQAIPEFERAIAIDRYSSSAYGQLAYCRFMRGAFDDVQPLERQAMRFAATDLGYGEYYRRTGMAEMLQQHPDRAVSWLEKARDVDAPRHDLGRYETFSELAAAYALDGDIGRASEALSEARKTNEYPANVAQFRRQWPLYASPGLRAVADATYFKGLTLAGLPEN